MDNLENQWNAAKKTISTSSANPEDLIRLATSKKKVFFTSTSVIL
jgi:hypothetical protein